MYIMLQFTHITTWRTSNLCVTTRVHCHRNKLWNVTPLTTAKIRTPEKYEFLGYSVSTPSSLRYRQFPCRCSGCVNNLWEYRVPVGHCLDEHFLTRHGTQTKLDTVIPRSVPGVID